MFIYNIRDSKKSILNIAGHCGCVGREIPCQEVCKNNAKIHGVGWNCRNSAKTHGLDEIAEIVSKSMG